MTGLPEEIADVLEDVYGPVAANFTVETVTRGDTPRDISEQWIGLTLPVRAAHLGQVTLAAAQESLDIVDPVIVANIDAMQALHEADKPGAAEYWAARQIDLFTFRASEGRLEPLDSENANTINV